MKNKIYKMYEFIYQDTKLFGVFCIVAKLANLKFTLNLLVFI